MDQTYRPVPFRSVTSILVVKAQIAKEADVPKIYRDQRKKEDVGCGKTKAKLPGAPKGKVK